MNSIVTKEHKALAGKLKQVLATYSEAEDLINIGAYKTDRIRISIMQSERIKK